jgi:O-antigen/teichoic acid export membrane protein
VQALLGGPLNESLEQRETLRSDHVNATFWISLLLSTSLAGGMMVFAQPVTGLLGAPEAGLVLTWLAAGLPIGAAAGVMRAVMIRDLRFKETSQIGAAARVVSSVAAIIAVLLGAGVWALVIADLAAQLFSLILLAGASQFRPGRPRRLGAIRDLMRFNLHTLATYVLGYVDQAAPRILTSAMLGAQSLGYLIIAGRVFDLLGQLVLSPLGAVTMTSVARLQSDREGLHKLIMGLYRLASLIAYPAFLGAIVITPALAGLAGETWLPAILTTQIMLLIGLRTATGAFNIGILRGLGRTRAPLVLLGAGVVLQLAFGPIGAQFGSAGVAAAMLARTYATWPLGCWFVKQACGVSIRDQLATGTPALIAALIMAGTTWGVLQGLTGSPPAIQLIAGIGVGLVSYPLALGLVSARARRIMSVAATMIFSSRRGRVMQDLKAEFGL